MAEQQNIQWKRLTIEAAAIVASILLAFAIDALWEEHLERLEEVDVLSQLHKEFSANSALIAEMKDVCTASCQAEKTSNQIYKSIDQALSNGASTIDVPNLALDGLIGAGTFEAETPVLDGLVQSGRLAVIQDQRVLSAIATWDRFLRDSLEIQQRARRNVDTYVIPALIKRGDVGNALKNHAHQMYDDEFDFSGITILSIDMELKGVIGQRYENATRSNNTMDRTQRAADEVLAAIEVAQSVGVAPQ